MRMTCGAQKYLLAGALGLAVATLLGIAGPRAAASGDPFAAMDVQRAVRETPAPPFRLRRLHGQPLALEELKGKVIAFYFWRTW